MPKSYVLDVPEDWHLKLLDFQTAERNHPGQPFGNKSALNLNATKLGITINADLGIPLLPWLD